MNFFESFPHSPDIHNFRPSQPSPSAYAGFRTAIMFKINWEGVHLSFGAFAPRSRGNAPPPPISEDEALEAKEMAANVQDNYISLAREYRDEGNPNIEKIFTQHKLQDDSSLVYNLMRAEQVLARVRRMSPAFQHVVTERGIFERGITHDSYETILKKNINNAEKLDALQTHLAREFGPRSLAPTSSSGAASVMSETGMFFFVLLWTILTGFQARSNPRQALSENAMRFLPNKAVQEPLTRPRLLPPTHLLVYLSLSH